MRGTDCTNGKELSGMAHLRQSITDILTTPLSSRVMRRDYGSRLYRLVDAPANRETIMEIYHATAAAIVRWEPRIQLERVICESIEPGRIILSLVGLYIPDRRRVTLDGIVVK